MLTALVPFLSNKWSKLGIELAFVAVLGLGARAYFTAEGKRAGRDEVTQVVQQQIDKARQQDTANLNKVVTQATNETVSARKEKAVALAALSKANTTLADISRQRSNDSAKVQALPASALHSYIATMLNLRPAQQHDQPGYTDIEERVLATCVTQYPACQKQLSTYQQASADQQAHNKAADRLDAAQGVIASAQADFVDKLDAHFVKLYNLHPPRYRAMRCLWLWHCRAAQVRLVRRGAL